MMARAAIAGSRRVGHGPRIGARLVPALSVIAASLLSTLPVMSSTGWFPEFGFLMLVAWRLLRADAWPAWWAAPLGLINDLVTGSPIGLSVTVWTGAMIALDMLDRRTMWRDYWIEWALAGFLILAHEFVEWRVAVLSGADLPISTIVPPLLISIFCFPIAAWFAARIDLWRLGR